MPPTIALIFCLTFVAGLLLMEQQRSQLRSWDVWLPTLWILYCGSRPVGYWLGSGAVFEDGDFSVQAGSSVERIVLSLMILAALVMLMNRRIYWSEVLRENRWLIILFAYMFVSILWSDFPYVSFKRWVKASGTVLIALVVLTGPRPREILQSVFIKTAYILVPVSVLLVKYFQGYGVTYNQWSHTPMWQGATLTKNTLGVLCLISILFLIWSMIRRKRETEPPVGKLAGWGDLAVILMALWLLRGPGGAYSASSVGALFLGVITFFVLYRFKGIERNLNRLVVLGLVGIGLIFLLGNLLEFSPLALVTSMLGRDATLTGRTEEIWAPLIKIALEHPIFGLGFGGFWVRQFPGQVNEAHNGYLDVFLQLGVMGILLLAAVLVAFYRKAREEFHLDKDWGALRLAILIIAVAHNFTETSWLGDTMLLWNVFVCLAVVCPSDETSEEAVEMTSATSHSKEDLQGDYVSG